MRQIATSSSVLDVSIKERDAAITERDKALAHAEMLDSIVPFLEAMRNEMKALLLEAKAALLEAGVPKRQKPDKDVPFWYGEHSWMNTEVIPWNVGKKRAMTPAKEVEWLALQLELANAQAKVQRK